MTLPAAATYTVCYRTNETWQTLTPTFTVPAQNAATVALDALYTATNGASWTYNEYWGSAQPVCSWYGIRCNSADEITGIFLSNNNLDGALPTAFFLASYFKTILDLKLDGNSITGPIPDEIGLFRNLRHFDIGFNAGLTGAPPVTLLSCALQTLYASNSGLSGNIPHELTLLTRQWFNQPTLYAEPAPADIPFCPVYELVCSDIGSTDVGVSQCGNTDITEEECEVMGCCFNIQAPLTFGGTACFTKKPLQAADYPTCEAVTCSLS